MGKITARASAGIRRPQEPIIIIGNWEFMGVGKGGTEDQEKGMTVFTKHQGNTLSGACIFRGVKGVCVK